LLCGKIQAYRAGPNQPIIGSADSDMTTLPRGRDAQPSPISSVPDASILPQPVGVCLCCDLPIDDCEHGGEGIRELTGKYLWGDTAIDAYLEEISPLKGVKDVDLGKHTVDCLNGSWKHYGVSPLDKHVCICDGRGNPPEWADLDRERRIVGEMELTERLATVEARQRARLGIPEEGDGPPVAATLADLVAVFGDDVDLTPTPAIWERVDGNLILPAGKLSWIYGYPGCGKSFLCEICLIEAVMRGGRALYLDYEDNQKTFHQRAALLGFHPKTYADSFMYIHGGLSEYPGAQAEALEWLAQSPNPEMNLVIIDAAESSGCPSDGSQINDWLKQVVMPWHNREVNNAVLVADHIPKTKDNRPDGPIGSQRKLAATDGINLLVGGYCWTKKKNGRLTLINDKDRTGEYAKKEPVATIIGKWDGDGDARGFSQVAIEPTKDDTANVNIGGAILEAIDAAGPTGFKGKNKLYHAVGGNRNAVFTTIDNLVEGGLVDVKSGSSDTYTLTDEGREFVG
jgi:predicted transcriptional regulator